MVKNLNTRKYWNKVYLSEYTGNTYKEDHKMSSKNYCRGYKDVFEKIIGKIPEKSSVLDVACGPGIFCRELKKKKKEVNITGIDFSDVVIKINKEKDKNLGIKYIKCDIRKELSFSLKKKFDVIVMSEIIEHLASPQKVFSNIMKYLKAGGLIFLACPYGDYWDEVMKKEKTRGEHVKHWDYNDVFGLLSQYGAEVTFLKCNPPFDWTILAYTKKNKN